MKKNLLFLLIIAAVLLCFVSCGEKSYIVSFDANGAEMETERIKVEYGKGYKLPEPERLGYGFLGWYNGEEKVELTGTWNIEGDVNLVAKWEFLEFTITCDVDGDGTFESKYEYNSMSNTFEIENPTKDGMIFSHWIDKNGNVFDRDLVIKSGSEGSYDLTAVWWDYVYDDVIFEYNGETLKVVGYKGKFKKDIYIPSKIFEVDVVSIGEGAFEGLEAYAIPLGYVSRLYIPKTVKYIGDNAFNRCRNIKVSIYSSYTEEDINEITRWLQGVEISSVGNDDLVDVLLLKKPAIGSSYYEKFE